MLSGENGVQGKRRRIQASAVVQLRPLLFWDVTQRMLVAVCRRFGTAYRSHLQGSSSPEECNCMTLKDGYSLSR